MAAAAAHRFECIDSALEVLQDNHYNYMMRQTRGETVDDCLFFKTQQIKADWELLKMLWELLRKWSAAVDVIVQQKVESLALKIEAAGDTFGRFCMEMNKNPGHKLFESVVELQRRSDYLILSEIRVTFRDWWSSCGSFPVRSLPDDLSFWTSFVDSVMLNLLSVGLGCSDNRNYLDRSISRRVSEFYDEVKFLRRYIIFAVELLKSVIIHLHEEVDDFFNHFASVIVCTATELCKYWFNQKIPELRELEKGLFDARLKDLQHEIDLKNPRFMNFHLKFLIALNEIEVLDPDKVPKHRIRETTLYFLELLDSKNIIRPKLKELDPQLPLPNFPKTYNLVFIDFLARKLMELLEHTPEPIEPLEKRIREILLHLESLSSFLTKVSESDIDEHLELKDLRSRITDIAYEIEYVIESIEVNAQWQYFFWFHDLLEELRLVDQQASRIHKAMDDAKVQNVNPVPRNMISRGRRPTIDEKMVELRDEEEVILNQLTRGSSKRDIVSIVGMPGIGKTTLARKVYNNQQVIYHFHQRAWCAVSQVYEKRELLIEILHDIQGLTNENYQMSEEDLESKLRQFLLKNRYLIVMDDVWDIGAWNGLKDAFPDNINGSRILITSRLHDVASEIKPNGDPHTLRLFSDDESWKLLEEKVFQAEGCPDELLLVGKQIAQQCKGLPLAVVAISGVLQRTQKGKKWWEKIAQSLSSEIMKDPDARCMDILELSYKHLPGYLKACFLYLGVFIEHKDIPVSKLIRYWIAEGFIKEAESKSLEDLAEDCLMDLINRSLVLISKRRSNGKVKSCRLHDLLRDLCHSKAKEENFLQLVTKSDEPYASFPASDYGFEFDFDHPIEHVTYKAYRLCIFLKQVHFVESRPSGLGTRSIIFCASIDSEPTCPYDISFIYYNFKFLQVLDLESINVGVSFPVEIRLLVRLRYLAVSGYMRSVPQSIANLQKLETLVVKGLRGKVVLPNTVFRMKSLRHLHVNTHVAFDLDDKKFGDRFLENLVSLSRPSLSCGENTEKIMKRFPNLCKLKCIFFESRDSSKSYNQFPVLNFLTKLESLNIFYYGRVLSSSAFILPLCLKKLTLSNFHLPWNRISAIGRLPNLQVLKLVCGAFEGKIWDMTEGEFQELVFLKLDSLNIVQWNASCDHLPKLQHLVIQNCKDLQNVPYDFENITSLGMIEVIRCGQSAEDSAKEIGEETEGINVLISRS